MRCSAKGATRTLRQLPAAFAVLRHGAAAPRPSTTSPWQRRHEQASSTDGKSRSSSAASCWPRRRASGAWCSRASPAKRASYCAAPYCFARSGPARRGGSGSMRPAPSPCTWAATATPASRRGQAAQVTCRDGAISPGLINAHDHHLQTRATTHPTNPATTATVAPQGVSGDPKRPKIPVAWQQQRRRRSGGAIAAGARRNHLARRLRRSCRPFAQLSIRRCRRGFCSRRWTRTLSAGDKRWAAAGQRLHHPLALRGSLNPDGAYLPHISEGIQEARNEFLCTSQPRGDGAFLVEDFTAIVHAIALSAGGQTVAAARAAVVVAAQQYLPVRAHGAGGDARPRRRPFDPGHGLDGFGLHEPPA